MYGWMAGWIGLVVVLRGCAVWRWWLLLDSRNWLRSGIEDWMVMVVLVRVVGSHCAMLQLQ